MSDREVVGWFLIGSVGVLAGFWALLLLIGALLRWPWLGLVLVVLCGLVGAYLVVTS